MDSQKLISSMIEELSHNQAPVFLSTDRVDTVFQTRILAKSDTELVLENRVPLEHISSFVNSGKFHIQAQLLRLEADSISSNGKNIVFPLSDLVIKQDSRSAKRFFFTEDKDVFLEVLNPYDRETILKKSIIDISSTGISIKSPVQSELYAPGTQFSNMKILVNGELYNKAEGHVVYSRKFLDLEGKYYYQIGFQFNTPVS